MRSTVDYKLITRDIFWSSSNIGEIKKLQCLEYFLTIEECVRHRHRHRHNEHQSKY